MGVKRGRSSSRMVTDVWERQVGLLSSTTFVNRLSASKDIVLRYEIERKLENHRGCVNTVGFNATGDVLISGSDDTRVVLWDWEAGRLNYSFPSGHTNNVFQAKFMPFTNDHTIVTCAADGQVRLAQLVQGAAAAARTSLLGTHQGRAHKLAIQPASPCLFFTCGEDGLVQHFDLRTKASTPLFTCHSTCQQRSYMPIVHLNTIAIDPLNPNLFVVGGSDEFTRLYDMRNYKWDGSTDFDRPVSYYCPQHLVGDEQVGITGLAFSNQAELLVSYNDEHIYLFSKEMGLGPNPPLPTYGDTDTDSDGCHDSPVTDSDNKPPAPQVFKGHRNRQTVKGVGFFGPKSEYVVSGSDCGRIFIWMKKDGELIRAMEADKHVVNCIESHPHSTVLASSGIERDIKIWTPKAEEKATLPPNLDELRPRRRGWMYRVTSPQELLLQLFSLENHQSSPEHDGENSASTQDFLELILSLGRHNGNSSDDGGDDSGPDDYFS